MGHAPRDQSRYTYGDYRTWPGDVRYELVDGAALMMAPAPSVDHQTLAFEVGRQLGNALEGHPCRVLLAPVDVLLSRADETDDAVAILMYRNLHFGSCARAALRRGPLTTISPQALTEFTQAFP